MAYSTKIIQNGYVSQEGESMIYMRIIIDRQKKVIPLKIKWPTKYFDKDSGKLLQRSKDDKQAADYNLIISQALGKANEVFIYFRLSGLPITLEKFTKAFKTDISKQDFVTYYSQRAKLRLKDKEIEESTYNDHLKTLRKLQLFNASITFADIDENWAYTFDAFMKKNIKSRNGDSTNVRWAHHKNVRTYIRLAAKDHINIVYPYKYFSIKAIDSQWKSIYEKDVRKLWEYYHSPTAASNLQKAVTRFLFMVHTGLRRVDLDRVTTEWLVNGELHFVQQKNKRFGKLTKVPLSTAAVEIWNNVTAGAEPNQLVFKYFSEQKSNLYLSKVAELLHIDSPIHHHIGRHTFITLLLKNGASLDMTSKYAGHATVAQTMKYNHPDEERRKKEILFLDKITA
jgi:integrase